MSTTIKQAINEFLLSCKVEGKSYGTIECYTDKLKGFLWYATNSHWPDDVKAITTNHLREFLAYLRETTHRFNSSWSFMPIKSDFISICLSFPLPFFAYLISWYANFTPELLWNQRS
jgi:site-specific recombinase XerD